MLNKLTKLIQNPSTKRLALAIVVSAVLHAYLVGGLDISLPKDKPELHSIEARLQMPKVVKAVKEKTQENIAKETKIKEKKTQPEPVTEPLPQVVNQELTPDPEPSIPESKPEELPEVSDSNSTAIDQTTIPEPQEASQAETSDPAEIEPQPIDTGLVINENAYQYVETDFNVRTEIDGVTEGSAKIVFSLTDGNQYQLTSVIEPHGLAAMFISNLLQTSAGQLTKSGLQPESYLYQYGDKADKTYTAKFDWQNKTVSLTTAKGTKKEQIEDGTQDLLSFMYQFMYVAPLQRMQISIATGKKLTNYDYSFAGEENINIPLGEIKTIHIFHENENADEKTDLWLALDYQYVPVKIRKTEKNGKIYELAATWINTARPVVLN